MDSREFSYRTAPLPKIDRTENWKRALVLFGLAAFDLYVVQMFFGWKPAIGTALVVVAIAVRAFVRR